MLRKEIEETIEIAAGPSEVWWQLTSFETYSDWNPLITRIEGELREGASLAVTLQPNGTPPLVLKPTVVTVEPERELRWKERIALPNLLEGEHSFLIESLGVHRVRLTQRQVFKGMLVPGAFALTAKHFQRGLREMNLALRQRAEAAHAMNEVARAEAQTAGE